MKNLGIVILLSSMFLFQSCMTNTAFQTGRTIGKHNVELLGGASSTPEIEATQVHANVRFGVSDKLDVDLGATMGISYVVFNASANAKVKYQFIGDQHSKFAASIGAGLTTDIWNSVNGELPLYLSYHPTPKFAVYSSPRYSRSLVASDLDQSFKSFGIVNGIKISLVNNPSSVLKEVGLFIEHGYSNVQYNDGFNFLDSNDAERNGTMNQISVGISTKF